MNDLRDGLFALTLMALLPACTAPIDPDPGTPSSSASTAPEPSGPAGATASWSAPGAVFKAVAAASAGDEGAVAYVESSAAKARIKLQRLDSRGARRGDAIELGVLGTELPSGLTIASDGSRYIICWSDDAQIACATAPAGEGSASPWLARAGSTPALAYAEGTWALAHSLPGKLALVKLTSDGALAGSPTLFDDEHDGTLRPTPLLAATHDGFVLVGGSRVHMHLLDHALEPIAAPMDLGKNAWFFAGLATSGSRVAINLAEPYGSIAFLFDGAALLDSQAYGGGGKVGLRVALAAEGSSFGMLSGTDDGSSTGGLVYRLLAPSVEPAEASVLPEDTRSYDGAPMALLRLKGEMFLAATQAYSGEEIVVARLPRL